MMLTAPFRHQTAAQIVSGDAPAFALFMEPGTGKTRVILERALRLHRAHRIEALVIVAPNGVHRVWIEEQVPIHCAPELWVAAWWRSSMNKAQALKWHAAAFAISPPPALRILALNVEAMSLPTGEKILKHLLTTYRCYLVEDESGRIKTPSARRTKTLVRLAPLAPYRSILNGLPIEQSPLDLYSQFQFLEPGSLGCPNFTTFKNHYAEWRQRILDNGQRFQEVVRYRNLDELRERTARISFTVKKEDCLDLPPKVYETVLVPLDEPTTHLYRAMKKAVLLELLNGELTLPNAIARLMRLQQLAGGFQAYDRHEPELVWSGKLAALLEFLRNLPATRKAIIFARYIAELRAIAAQLAGAFDAAPACWWGGIRSDERKAGMEAFQDPNSSTRFFVGQPAAAGYGLTLHAASYVIYYSNDFSLATRLQSEDRAHRIGQEKSVTYIDLVTEGTVDQRVLTVLKSKRDLSTVLTRADIKEWLTDG